MQNQTLLKLLLSMTDGPRREIAAAVDMSESSLSRHATGLLRRPASLRRLAEHFTGEIGGKTVVTPNLLTQQISAASLLVLANHLLEESIRAKRALLQGNIK